MPVAKRPLDDDCWNRLALLLDVVSDQLAAVEVELSGAYLVRTGQVKAVRRAVRAVDAATRALDRLDRPTTHSTHT